MIKVNNNQLSINLIQSYKRILIHPHVTPDHAYNTLLIIRSYLTNQINSVIIDRIVYSGLHLAVFHWLKNLLTLFINQNVSQQNQKMYAQIINQCIWIFTNLCMDQTGKVQQFVELGIIQITYKTLFMLKYPQIVQSTLQLIGNLTGQNSIQIKMAYLKSQDFYMFLKNNSKLLWNCNGIDEYITWVLANLFRHFSKFVGQSNEIKAIFQLYLPIVLQFLDLPTQKYNTQINIYYVLLNATQQWEFFYLQIHSAIGERFQNANEQIKRMIIQVYGNMAALSDFGVKVIIQNFLLLSYILEALKNKQPTERQAKYMKSYAWILSNIFAGTQDQIDYLLARFPTFFNQIYEILYVNQKSEIVRELIWALCNFMQSCSLSAFESLYTSNVLNCMGQKISQIMIQNQDETIALVYLAGIQNYIQKIKQFPGKFEMQTNQKIALLAALNHFKMATKDKKHIIRFNDAITFLESVIMVGELNSFGIS